MINMVVGEAITGLSPKDKVTKGMLLTKMNSIHEKIITKLFVPPVDPDENEDNGTYLVDSDEEFEPEDHSLDMNYNYALATHISAQYEKVKEKSFLQGTLKRELADELIDMVDSEIFAGALYELMNASFKSTIINYLHGELETRMQKPRKKSSAALLVVPTTTE